MDVRDPARDRVLHRDHAEIRLAVFQGGEAVLERRAGDGLVVGKGIAAGHVRVGAVFALEDDLLVCRHERKPACLSGVGSGCGMAEHGAHGLEVGLRVDVHRT